MLPQSSVAVQVLEITWLFPQPLAEASEYVTTALPQLSAAVAVPVFDGSTLSVHSTFVSAGIVKIGGVVSLTVIIDTCSVSLLHKSVAVQVRVSV